MRITLDIKDENQLQLIEQLRGDKSAKEFVRLAMEAGLAMAGAQRRQLKEAEENGHLIRFSPSKPEFKALNVAAITDALKDKDPNNPVKVEVARLVRDYTTELRKHAEKNGNKLPARMKVHPQTEIERVALQLTANVIRQSAKAAGKKAAAAK